MRIAVTGSEGFLAWHVRAVLTAKPGLNALCIDRQAFGQPDALDRLISAADAVIHLAGVNRANDDAEISEVNPQLAARLTEALRRTGKRIPVVYANSIHARHSTTFGKAKRKAAEILVADGEREGYPVLNFQLPNVFGEGGRPRYNSVVATFAHALANGAPTVVEEDRELPLAHAVLVAERLVDASIDPLHADLDLPVTRMRVSEVLRRLEEIAGPYREGQLPDLSHEFTRDLFNTYRSATFPSQWPKVIQAHQDPRGSLHEAMRSRGGPAQVFFSTTRPGASRGNHFHLRKFERFLVMQGEAEIILRRLFGSDVIRFPVSGDSPVFIDMPTLWTHALVNTGDRDVTTLFYADQVFDPAHADTYAEVVLT